MWKKLPAMRKIILFMGDMFVVVMSLQLASLLVTWYYGGSAVGVELRNEMLPVTVLVAGLMLNVNGLFYLARKTVSEIVIGLLATVVNTLVIMMAINFFLRDFSYSRSILLLAMFIQFILLVSWNYLFWKIEHSLMIPRNALVIGSMEECKRMVLRLESLPHLKDHVKYVSTECGYECWKTIAKNIDLVIVCSDLKLQDKAEIVRFCQVYRKQIFIVPSFYELYCSSVDLDKIDDIPVFRPTYLHPTLEQRFLKRLLDIAVSMGALLALWPLFAVIAVAVKLNSPGPVIYSQVRSGRYGREFKVHKFRTMRQDAEQFTGPVLAVENDPRVTRIGRFLRATRLDELPQLLNVFVGDMSIVGPRPERPYFVEKYKAEIAEYGYRSNVKPGITGLAQVHGKYNTTANDKLIYDLLYIQRYNILTDFVIMLQTLKVLMSKGSTAGVRKQLDKADLTQYQIYGGLETAVQSVRMTKKESKRCRDIFPARLCRLEN